MTAVQDTVRTGPSRPGLPVRRPRRAHVGSNAIGYLFMAPMIIALGAFVIYPIIETGRLSLTDSNGVTGTFIGFRNYTDTLADRTFWEALWNTFYIGFWTIIIGLPLSLLVALLINSLPAFKSLAKAVYFLPNITSAIATATAFTYLFYPSEKGWFNTALGWVGIEPLGWFTDPSWARFGVALMAIWHGLGYTTLIWLAGLQAIPQELHEAAATDGANGRQAFRHVTLPGLRPMLVFLVIIETINSFKRFADVYQIGGPDGQPGGSLVTVMIYIYRTGFSSGAFGKASAACFILFAIVALMIALNMIVGRKR